jgi:general stress protein YciG
MGRTPDPNKEMKSYIRYTIVFLFNTATGIDLKSIYNLIPIWITMTNENKGLASADEETRERVAREGGKAQHEKRGLQAADQETREEVARKGGQS